MKLLKDKFNNYHIEYTEPRRIGPFKHISEAAQEAWRFGLKEKEEPQRPEGLEVVKEDWRKYEPR